MPSRTWCSISVSAPPVTSAVALRVLSVFPSSHSGSPSSRLSTYGCVFSVTDTASPLLSS